VRRHDRAAPSATRPTNGGGALLEASHISKVFGGLVAVNDVTFRVPPKAIVSLHRPERGGKTTFFNCLTGLYRPTTGRVLLDGKDITAKRATSSQGRSSRARSRTSSCSGR
jgi:ABC-type branched-subunit amino acid transport system ATPase component